MLDKDNVFNVPHFRMQFGTEKSSLKYVVSDDIEAISMFVKQHSLPKELMRGIESLPPGQQKNAEFDVLQIYHMKSNKDKKIYDVCTTDRIARACGVLAQRVITDDILFGYAVLETGYEFIAKIVQDVDELHWGFIPEYDMLDDGEDPFAGYSEYEWPSEYRPNYDIDGLFTVFSNSIDPHMEYIPLSLEGYVKTFRYLMEYPKEQFECCY